MSGIQTATRSQTNTFSEARLRAVMPPQYAYVIGDILESITLYENRLAGEMEVRAVEFDFDPDAGRTRVILERVLADFRKSAFTAKWEELSAELVRLTLRVRLPHRALCELLAALVEVQQVKAVREVPFKVKL